MEPMELDPHFFTTDAVEELEMDEENDEIMHNQEIERLITNIPEINDTPDVPDYVVLHETPLQLVEAHNDVIRKSSNLYMAPLVAVNDDHNYSSKIPCRKSGYFEHFCNICGIDLKDSVKYNQHLFYHIKINDVICPYCHENLRTTQCLQEHIEKIHTTLCDICGETVPTVQLQYHGIKTKRLKGNQVAASDAVHYCVICMKTIATEEQFDKHMGGHRRRRKIIVRKRVVVPTSEQQIKPDHSYGTVNADYLNSCLNAIWP